MSSRRPPTRREFLASAGVTLALPLFESLLPRTARAAPPSPQRYLAWFLPCGVNMATWRPATVGPDWAPTPSLRPLGPIRDKTLVLSGLANHVADSGVAGQHAAATASLLTAARCKQTEGPDIENGISVDQVIAQARGGATRFPSLQLGLDEGQAAGGTGMGYSPVYFQNVSWASSRQWLPKMMSPFQVWARLFAGYDAGRSAAEAKRRIAYKSSILDGLRAESAALRARLGQTDRRKLEDYEGGLRDLEKRIADSAVPPMCDAGQQPVVSGDPQVLMRQHIDLMVLAFQCDMTRVITFMLGQGASNRPYGFLGVNGAHHQLSHHGGVPETLAQLTLIDTWEVQLFADLCARLDAIVEPDGRTLLDHSAVLLASEVSDGDRHNHDDLPVLLAGTAGGAIRTTGQHLAYPADTPLANLHLSLLAAFGLPAKQFGVDGTKPLPEIAGA